MKAVVSSLVPGAWGPRGTLSLSLFFNHLCRNSCILDSVLWPQDLVLLLQAPQAAWFELWSGPNATSLPVWHINGRAPEGKVVPYSFLHSFIHLLSPHAPLPSTMCSWVPLFSLSTQRWRSTTRQPTCPTGPLNQTNWAFSHPHKNDNTHF